MYRTENNVQVKFIYKIYKKKIKKMLPSIFKSKLNHRVHGKASTLAHTSFTCVPKSTQTIVTATFFLLVRGDRESYN